MTKSIPRATARPSVVAVLVLTTVLLHGISSVLMESTAPLQLFIGIPVLMEVLLVQLLFSELNTFWLRGSRS